MISVVIPTLNDAARLPVTLAALGQAAIDGLVREVIVADAGSDDATLTIADDAGAVILRSDPAAALGAGCKAARQPWLLLLAAGARPQVGWEQAAWAHINDGVDQAGWFRLSLRGRGAKVRLAEAGAGLRARLFGGLRPEHGLLIARGLYDRAADGQGRPRLSPGALRRLDARILA